MRPLRSLAMARPGVCALALTMAFAVLACESEKPPTLEWDAGTRLTWSDFKGTPPDDPQHDAETATGITASSWKCEGGGFSFVGGRAYFNRPKSFSLPAKADGELLKHEQGHFDLTELYARKLRERLRQNTCDGGQEAIQGAINAALREIHTGFMADTEQYDQETNHGRDKAGQLEWDTKLRDQLELTQGQ